MKRSWMHVLKALRDGSVKHGWKLPDGNGHYDAWRQRGASCETIKTMQEAGLIERAPMPTGPTYLPGEVGYAITEAGRQALKDITAS